MYTPHSVTLVANSRTYITWSFLKICGNLEEINKNYLFKMLDKAHTKKKKGGEELTTTRCTILVLYWICLHTKTCEDNRRTRKHDSNNHKMAHEHDT
ncbi:hypothetical protein DVH24_042200 [Malus domestica]|uniref:Uncharacterized protein n=1 Tax=Malus domestica TaxID=3750 RepID=A0A498IXH1_MALDO|nr:hypothetical protein DVH24_042200 [Malus domestica]